MEERKMKTSSTKLGGTMKALDHFQSSTGSAYLTIQGNANANSVSSTNFDANKLAQKLHQKKEKNKNKKKSS